MSASVVLYGERSINRNSECTTDFVQGTSSTGCSASSRMNQSIDLLPSAQPVLLRVLGTVWEPFAVFTVKPTTGTGETPRTGKLTIPIARCDQALHAMMDECACFGSCNRYRHQIRRQRTERERGQTSALEIRVLSTCQ